MITMNDDHAEAIGIPTAMALAGESSHEPEEALRMPEVPAAPVAVAEPAPDAEPEPPGGPETIDDIRARLAARGLLATSPRIEVPKEPRPEGAETAPLSTFAPTLPDDGEEHWADNDADEWDVEPGSEEVTVRCPQCREVYFRPLESTRFACPTCDRAWRFAICEGCDVIAFTMERQESWRCGSCGHQSRSWWRTPTAPKTAIDVVARRKHQAIEEERRLIRAGMKKRRWKLIALAVWAAVIAIGVVVGVRMAEPSSATGSSVACRHFSDIRSALASGTLDRAGLDRELEALHTEAQGADDTIQKAVIDLRAATPGTSGFLVARTTLADACDALSNR